MDQDTIRQLAIEIASRLPNYSWTTLLIIQGLITVVAAGVGAFFGEFFKTRGKNLATKADFAELQRQLRQSTELIESIKAEVSQRDWTKREWTTLRRNKLERLLDLMHAAGTFLDRYDTSANEGKALAGEFDPKDEFATLVELYFPS